MSCFQKSSFLIEICIHSTKEERGIHKNYQQKLRRARLNLMCICTASIFAHIFTNDYYDAEIHRWIPSEP